MTRIVISPHLDDAVLSVGQFMATEHCMVVTVFAGLPDRGFVSDYDRSAGFDSSHRAMEYRRQEDTLACGEVGATPVHWEFLDQQYGRPPAPKALRDAFAALLVGTSAPFVPLGIGHPDHRMVARCARKTVAELSGMMFVYEELPYRVLNPEQVAAAFADLDREGWQRADLVEPLESGPAMAKRAAIARYRSQFPRGAEDPPLMCPERVWRCWR